MILNNDLTGLNSSGFQNSEIEFNRDIFKENITIGIIRPLIKKYFVQTKTIYRGSSSYGIKHVVERNIGTYVSNGELIYAMDLEGFNIVRDSINCFFNISQKDIRLLSNSKPILETLSVPLNNEISDYIKHEKGFMKFKYNFKFLIETKFWSQPDFKKDVLKIVSKEINESLENVRSWVNTLKVQDTIIPKEKMELLEKIFNLSQNKLVNQE